MHTLNLEQQNAVECTAKETLIMAGPGSGKTRVLIQKIQHLERTGLAHPSSIVAITFTNAAANEIQQRLGEMTLGYCGTIHGFMMGLLKSHGQDLGFNENTIILDEQQAELVLQKVIKDLRYKGPLVKCRLEIANGPPIKKPNYTDQERVCLAYYADLRAGNMIDFDGILIYGSQIAKTWDNPQGFTYLFVDEFQDSGRWDYQIFSSLDIQNKILLGDPDQAIYSFRGGNVENILGVNDVLPADAIFTLSSNYRCGADIANTAQKLIEHNKQRVVKKTVSVTPYAGEIQIWHNVDSPQAEIRDILTDLRARQIKTDCAILVFTNHLVDEFTKALEADGFQVIKRKTRDEPKDAGLIRMLVSLMINPDNDTLFLRYLMATKGTIEADTIHMKALEGYTSINGFLKKFDRAHMPQDMLNFLGKEGISAEGIEWVTGHLNRKNCTTLHDLQIALTMEEKQPEKQEGITVSTMHRAKGLEFETVYLPAFEQELIPGARAVSGPFNEGLWQLEEQRRLAYVAITRAKKRLVISYALLRANQWERVPKRATPSQFLKEMGLIPTA